MKETLSDNELTLKEINELLPIDSNTKFYAGEVIKQFIKDLMDLWGYSYDGSISMMGDDIIRLAGPKLIEEKQ